MAFASLWSALLFKQRFAKVVNFSALGCLNCAWNEKDVRRRSRQSSTYRQFHLLHVHIELGHDIDINNIGSFEHLFDRLWRVVLFPEDRQLSTFTRWHCSIIRSRMVQRQILKSNRIESIARSILSSSYVDSDAKRHTDPKDVNIQTLIFHTGDDRLIGDRSVFLERRRFTFEIILWRRKKKKSNAVLPSIVISNCCCVKWENRKKTFLLEMLQVMLNSSTLSLCAFHRSVA